MSVSRIIIFAVGAILTILGAYWLIVSFPNPIPMLIALVVLAVGIVLLMGKVLSL